jgi:hypothetical protein
VLVDFWLLCFTTSKNVFLCVCADEVITTNEPIEADKSREEIRQEPYSLPVGFCWDSLDIDNPIVVSNRCLDVYCGIHSHK